MGFNEMMKKLIQLTAFLLLCSAFFIHAGEWDKNITKGFEAIQPMEVYNFCKKIAAAEFAGRLTGHVGYTRAAQWAAEEFAAWRLKAINATEGFLQPFPSPYTIIDKAEMSISLPQKTGQTEQPEEIRLEPGTDFLPLLFSDSGDHIAAAVFAGWGICAPELGYDDYVGIDVAGKFVLCFRGVPDGDEPGFEQYDEHRQRMKTAKERGALGIFYIYPEPIAMPNGDWIEGFAPAVISEKIADRVLEEKKIKTADLKSDLQTYRKPLSFPLNSTINYRVVSQHFPHAIGYNVVGIITGSDATLKNECVVIGGHFDHCGEHLSMLFGGANDNGSGSAVVLALAQAFSKLAKKPKRSLVFVLFGGEEMGLLGSKYFVNHVPPQFDKIDAMFNFDMVGEGDGASCGYSASSAEMKQTIEKADAQIHAVRNKWEIKQIGVRSSDFAPFFLQGATCAAFFSNGPHLHYHKTGDTIYRINPDVLADIARLAFCCALDWANR